MNHQESAKELLERQQLQTLLEAIIPYLPRPVVEEQMADPEPGRVKGEYWLGSVLFADLSGFTALSETLSALGKQGAEEITRIVNDLFSALLRDVERYGGILVKFGGDALTVYFGGDYHAFRAARTGLALQETMARRFVKLETLGGVFTLRLRVGVHTGRIFAAQVGYDPNYHLRGMELVVTGVDINRVAEAQDYAAPGQVCITAETLVKIITQAEVEPIGGGMYRLKALAPFMPIESLPQAPPLSPSGRPALPSLRLRLQAIRPYLPVDLADERITDLADPGLRPDLRPVAVLFANFTDFSGILASLAGKGEAGVQAATNVLNMYYTRMQDVIGRYGGIVNKVDMYTHGDKLMAIFGAPLAHGDDIERAVRAALEMQASMPDINRYTQTVLEEVGVPFLPLSQRIGINYGHVFAGNVGSERKGSRREYTVMGDTVNLAARLMAAAAEDQILVSPTVHRQIVDKFKLEELAPVSVKGKARSISIWRPLRPLTERERLARRRGSRPFIGRKAHLTEIQTAAQAAMDGQGRIVVIVGEAGTGKTRLIEAFQDRLASSKIPLRYYVTELTAYAQEPYAPIINLLRRLIGLGAGQTAGDAARLRAWVNVHAPDLKQFLPLLGDLLAASIADNPVTAALSPEQRRDRLFDLIEAALHSEAQASPLALVVDDLQWGDESSLALLERLARGAVGAPFLLVLACRPDVAFPEPWKEMAHTHILQVAEFSRRENVQQVAELLETKELPADLAEIVWSKAQGNPFFTEEFVKSLRETGVIVRDDGNWQLAASAMDEAVVTAIPDTIEGIVLARLDRLEARCRDVLQEAAVAAVSQARFARTLLERVNSHPVELPERLRSLVNVGMLEALESELETLEYHFRHTLTRDVAYDSLLYARRRQLHLVIAQAMEALYADRLEEHVASLAHHYREAEAWPQALLYQRRAGERAQVLFANKDAIAHFHRAVTTIEKHLPEMLEALDSAAIVEALIDVWERLGDVLLIEGRYDEALESYAQARRLLMQDGLPDVLARFCRKTAAVYERKADYPLALDWLERGLAVLSDQKVVEVARIYNLGGGVFYRQGQREQALQWLQRALHIAERLDAQSEIANAYLTMAVTYSELGDTDRSLAFGQRCLQAYEAAGDLTGSVKARINLGIISRKAGEWAEAAEHYRAGLYLSEMMSDRMRIGQFANNMGNVYLDQGKLGEAAAAYRRSIEMWQPSGFLYGVAAAYINLGKVAVTRGNLGEGLTYLDEALALAQEIGARGYLPEIYHWQALLYLARHQYGQALELAEQAFKLARELKDRAEQGGALRVLGQIHVALENLAQAREHFNASLECFKTLKSVYETARTSFQLALAHLGDPAQRAKGLELLYQAQTVFAELGAQWDLAQTERAIQRFAV